MFETLTRIAERLNPEGGQALAEYAFVLGLIALAAVVALGLLGIAIGGPFLDFVSQSGFGSASS